MILIANEMLKALSNGCGQTTSLTTKDETLYFDSTEDLNMVL